MGLVPKKEKPDFPSILALDLNDSGEKMVSFSHVLELAADNDVDGFKNYVESNPDALDEAGLWYGRQAGSKGMVLEYRTPLIVAAMYGSLDVMKVILSLSNVGVNGYCGSDKTTALHCAASGGFIDAVKLLLVNGADLNVVDGKGNRPFDVIPVLQNQREVRASLEEVLNGDCLGDQKESKVLTNGLKVAPLSIPTVSDEKSSELENCVSPVCLKGNNDGKKEYPVDPSLPDIKNSIYSTDEFRMYSFKVRPCSRAYSHDWTECPFVHPGENARRRDPRKYHYSCVPCPEFRKGSCRRNDMCEYAHGVFECWLHPAQYRTRLCKDGTSCNRRVCFFAHLPEELRPLYASTGSAVPSPRSMASGATVMDMAAALNLFPGSPSGASAMLPNPFTPPMSPSGNGSSGWPQLNIPTLHLPGSNFQTNNGLQASRLRSSLNARDIHELELFSQPQFNSPSARLRALAPSNLDELFTSDMPSIFSPSHKSTVMNHFQQQQNMLSPINTKPMMQASFGPSSPGMMSSPRGIDPQSPLNTRLAALALREKHHQMRSLSARDLSVHLPRDLIPDNNNGGSPVSAWPKWESYNGRPDWSINGDELSQLKRSYSTGPNHGEPDLSWVQSLVKDQLSETKEAQTNTVSGPNNCVDDPNPNPNSKLDQIVAQ